MESLLQGLLITATESLVTSLSSIGHGIRRKEEGTLGPVIGMYFLNYFQSTLTWTRAHLNLEVKIKTKIVPQINKTSTIIAWLVKLYHIGHFWVTVQKTFHTKISLNALKWNCMWKTSWNERFHMKTHLDSEAKGNLEIAYCNPRSASLTWLKNQWCRWYC